MKSLFSVICLVSLVCGITYSEVNVDDLKKYVKEANFTTNQFCVKVLDLSTGKTLFSIDDHDIWNTPMAMGSQVKLFTIITKAKTEDIDIFATNNCTKYNPASSVVEQCWFKEGHGWLNLMQGLAYSCNNYFYSFARDINFKLFLYTLREWQVIDGFQSQRKRFYTDNQKIMAMIGRMNFILIKPKNMLNAYIRFYTKKKAVPQYLYDVILDGFHSGYVYGTTSHAREHYYMPPNWPIYCKTGTGAYENEDGDLLFWRINGFFIALYDDRYAVFAFQERGSGSDEAAYIGLGVLNRIIRTEMKTAKE